MEDVFFWMLFFALKLLTHVIRLLLIRSAMLTVISTFLPKNYGNKFNKIREITRKKIKIWM